MSEPTLRQCKFCGQCVDTPCMDKTDLLVYRVTIDRCNDAAWKYVGFRR